LSDIENGRSNPSIKRLEEIAHSLNTTTAYLIEGDSVSAKDFPDTFQSDPIFQELIDYLNNFEEWSSADKEELLMYLKAKSVIRSEISETNPHNKKF